MVKIRIRVRVRVKVGYRISTNVPGFDVSRF